MQLPPVPTRHQRERGDLVSAGVRQAVDALLAERFGAPPRSEARRPAVTPDTTTSVVDRQRVLCEALDGHPLIAVPAARGAA